MLCLMTFLLVSIQIFFSSVNLHFMNCYCYLHFILINSMYVICMKPLYVSFVCFMRPHGRLALTNELHSQNKDITYLITYLLIIFSTEIMPSYQKKKKKRKTITISICMNRFFF